jgi:hypothetical protein
MNNPLEYIYEEIKNLYNKIGIFQSQNIDFDNLEYMMRYYQRILGMIDDIIFDNRINKNNIRDQKSYEMYNFYEKRRRVVDDFVVQLKACYRIICVTNEVYDIYMKEQDEEKKRSLLSSYYLEYEKEYRLYQGAKVIDIHFSDKDCLEKIRFLLQEVRKIKSPVQEEKKKEVQEEKKREEQKNYAKLDIEQRIKAEFSSIYMRNSLYFRRPYDRAQSIYALNEMNDFFLEHEDLAEYIKGIDINTIEPRERIVLEQMQRILKDIEDYPDILNNRSKSQ